MKDLESIYSHTFENYNERSNDPAKTFMSRNDAITSDFTGKNWGAEDQNLENRKIRIKL